MPTDADRAVNKLMDFLARRDHSEKELLEKLTRTFSSADARHAIEFAKENRWLPDPEVLSQKVSEQLSRRGKGALYIRNYLRSKGLPQTTLNEDSEVEKGRALVIRLMSHEPPYDFEEKPKAARYLKNRGFADAVIRRVIYEEC